LLAILEIRVLLFSVLKEKVGTGSLTITLPDSATIEDLWKDLCRQYPAVEAFRPVARVAVNCEYVAGEHMLRDGDEVALITPVSGG
jgi:MoaE-MoaD fusion protein